MGQDAKKKVSPPGCTRQENIEVKRITIDPHADKDQREKVDCHLITDVIVRCALVPLIDDKPGQRDQEDDGYIQIAAPGGDRSLGCAGDQQNGC